VSCETADECEVYGDFAGLKYELGENEGNHEFGHYISWQGAEAVELLANLSEGTGLYDNYLNVRSSEVKLMYSKLSEIAVVPVRAHLSDTGFDLTLVREIKKVGKVTYYGTGLSVQASHGYYFDLVARSSLSKTGYIVANGIGIIDQNYTGEVIAALMKVDDEADELQLPLRAMQLIPRRWCHVETVELKNITDTIRGSGGFGST
jgi:dUTP pyrophosphatase